MALIRVVCGIRASILCAKENRILFFSTKTFATKIVGVKKEQGPVLTRFKILNNDDITLRKTRNNSKYARQVKFVIKANDRDKITVIYGERVYAHGVIGQFATCFDLICLKTIRDIS